MGVKTFFTFLFVLLMISSLTVYYFVPIGITDFNSEYNPNFNVDLYLPSKMQFYPNMRFPDKSISYDIDSSCNLEKRKETKQAFEILQEKTILEFYQTIQDPEIMITCDENERIEEGAFIAGEGGPTKIIGIGELNVITKGKVLLIRSSKCIWPNIAIHEILHVLGFDHSPNPNNVMYNFTDCSQTIGNDTIQLINELYSIPGYSDPTLKNVSARMRGKYLDLNFSVRNNGFVETIPFEVLVNIDDKVIKTFEIDSLKLGEGVSFKARNIWYGSEFDMMNITLVYNDNELLKENNYAILKIKSS
jgi:hypothetical protein